jgi:hypothetical protein
MTRGGVWSLSMASTAAQRALDLAEAAASMRRFYISLGMRKETLERTIELVKTTQPPFDKAKPPKRAKRCNAQ